MSYQILVLALVSIVAVVGVIQLRTEKSDGDISGLIIKSGIALIVSGIPSIAELIISLVAGLFSVTLPETKNPELLIKVGVFLLILGVITKIIGTKLKEKIYVLNMLGSSQKEISDEKTRQDLKIADYKLKEQILDVMPVFDKGLNMDARANEYIVKQIEKDSVKFAVKAKEKGGCFTGMAPIPYMIYAGTFLGDANVNRYFEFNGNAGERYYELKAKQGIFEKKWQELDVNIPPCPNSASEIVLAVSITSKIIDIQLEQFSGLPVVKIELPEAKDNIIQTKEQLIEYRSVIFEFLDKTIKELSPNIKKVHLVAAIPGCMALEIGKMIGLRENRMMEVVAYHYIGNNPIRYPFGIYVSGKCKGQFVKAD